MNQTRKRSAPDPWDIGFGVVVLAGALLALFVWFPADIPTGFFFVNAIGREEPGDAFFPIILALLLLVLSIIHLGQSFYRSWQGNAVPATGELTLDNFKFLGAFMIIMAISLAIMYWLGPLTVMALNVIGWLDTSYRALSDTVPYKFIGYVVGGFVMTITLIAWTEGRIRWAGVLSVLITLTVAILIFDLLLKNVLLPPNADY